MPTIKQINNNFSSGIISPVLNSRIDFAKTQNGLETCENFKVMIEGGVTVRPGSQFSVEVKDSSKTTVLIPFRAGLSGNYVLEFGDLYMRVHKKAGVVVEADQSITNITQANPAVVTYSGADNYANGDQVYITDVLGMTEINDSRLYYTVANVNTGANTFELQDRDGNNVDSTGFTAYSSAGTVNEIFELTTVYAEADLEDLRWTQNQDTLTITHQSYAPRDFARTSDTSWTITPYMKDAAEPGSTLLLKDGPYLELNSTDTTLTPSATSGTITMTASAVTGINDGDGFKSTDVGRLIRFFDRGFTTNITNITQANPAVFTYSGVDNLFNEDEIYITGVAGMTEVNDISNEYTITELVAGSNTFQVIDKDGQILDSSAFTAYSSGGKIQVKGLGTSHVLEIVTYNSTTSVDVVIRSETSPLASTIAQPIWRLGAWSDTTGFPKLSTYYQQRQWFFSTSSELDRIDASDINKFLTFEPGTEDSNSLSLTLPLTEVNAIYWVTASGSRLRVGTSSQIWSIWGGSDNITITPTNIQATPQAKINSKDVKAIDLGERTLFVGASGKILYDLLDRDGSLVPKNLTILSDEILGDLGDNTDTGVKKLAYQQTPGGYLWCIKNDGSLAGLTYAPEEDVFGWSNHTIGGTSVAVESIATLFDDVEDIIYMVVKRTINGVTRRYVEKLDTLFRGRKVDSGIFFDSAVVVEGTDPAQTLTLSAVSGTGVTATAGGASFVAGDVGKVIRSGEGRGIITGFTSTTVVTINATNTFSSTSIASGSWNLSINSVDGLDYLEGETVRVLANGGQLPDKTVSSGSISLGAEYNKVVIGLDYTKTFKLLKREGGSALGTNIGSRVKISNVYVTYFETVGGEVGTVTSDTDAILQRLGSDEAGKGIEPQTGFSNRKPPGGWGDDLVAFYTQPNGLPSTILSMTFKCEVND